MSDNVHYRKGGVITYPSGEKKNFSYSGCQGINKAKKESLRIQRAGRGLGRGDVKVLR